MAGWVPPRLLRWLVDDLDTISPDAVESLIGARLPESDDIEYKRQMFPTSDRGREQLAKSVASFANAAGGLIMIGVDGSGDGPRICGDDSPPQDLADRVHQVVATKVSPTPHVACRSVETEAGRVHLILVSPSVQKPHAVQRPRDSYAYPCRDGGRTRYLVPSEISDMYHRRYSASASAIDRLQNLHSHAATSLNDDLADSSAFLVLTCVPYRPGALVLTPSLADERLAWAQPLLRSLPPFHEYHTWRASVRFRSVELTGRFAVSSPVDIRTSLFLDGAGRSVLTYRGNPLRHASDTLAVRIVDIVSTLLAHIPLLARHAAGAGAVGDVEFGVQLLTRIETCLASLDWDEFVRVPEWIAIDSSTVIAYRSSPLSDATAITPDLVGLVDLLSSDVVSSFGFPTVPQITPTYGLNLYEFPADWAELLHAWNSANLVQLVRTTD